MQLKLATLGVFALLCSVANAQRDVLDLTKVRKAHYPGGMGRGSVSSVSASGIVPEQLPLSLTLQDVTATEATYGAEIGYAVAIKNTGPKAIEFPWSGEPDDGETPRPIDLSVFLTLVWVGTGDDLSIRTESIWGSKQVRNSIKLLQPGQEVLIRCRGSIQMAMSDAAGALVKSLPQRGALKAKLSFAKGAPVRAPLPLASDNGVPFVMLPRRSQTAK